MENTLYQLQPDNQKFRNLVIGVLFVVALFFTFAVRYVN